VSIQKESRFKIISAFIIVYIIWGSTYLAIRYAIATIPPLLMAGMRFFIAGSILFVIARFNNKEKLKLVHFRSAIIIGLLLLLGGNGGVVWAEQWVPSGITALLISTVPVWVAIISWIMPNGENPSLKNIIGVILGFIGLFFLVSPHNLISGGNVNLKGAIVLILGALAWAAGSVYTKHAEVPKSKLTTVALEMFFGGLSLIIVSYFFGDWNRFHPSLVSKDSLIAFIYLIIFGSLVAFTSYIWLLGAAGPAKATTYAYVNPVVAVILGYFIASEELSLKMIFAAIIIITAVVIIITDFSSLKSRLIRKTPGL
jgi:drug/metabolite transporter (DMT)-like permease